MSNDLPVLTSLSDNSTEVPVSAGRVENYVLLLVVLCVFAGGTLVLLSLLLLFCHRCCLAGRRYSRASDDPEKSMNTTYVEDSLPTQDITIRLDESDALSASSCHDGETERFLSTSSTGRRVSFNESALYEQERRESESKGRRYTLTEGDFHHLKKARLTHLHLAPPPSALNILTIMECDSAQSSTTNINETTPPAPPKPPLLAIYQPPERGMRPPTGTLDWMGQSLSGGLPGDPHHSTILDQDPGPPAPSSSSSTMNTQQHTRCSPTREAVGDREGDRDRTSRGGEGDLLPVPPPPPPPGGHTSVLLFLSKLRRHASLEGAGPYFRKWKFDSSHRAASLDAKGSPRRKPFQRQRAASETTEHAEEEEEDDLPHSTLPSQSSGLQSLSAGSLSPPPSATAASLSRLEVEAMVVMEESGLCSHTRIQEETDGPRGQRQEEEASSVEDAETGNGIEPPEAPDTWPEAAAGAWLRDDPGDDDLFEADQVVSVRGKAEDATLRGRAEPNHVRSEEDNGEKSVAADEETADDPGGLMMGAEARSRAYSGGGSTLSFMAGHQESSEARTPPSLYRDIWSLRASLEQYASSDQSSTDRESVRSDADSVSSLGGAGGGGGGARSVLDSCLSQDLDDLEPEADGEAEGEGRDWAAPPRGVPGGEDDGSGNMGNGLGGGGGGGEGDTGNRKLLSQMDSGYASIEAPPTRAPEELRLFGGTTPGPGGVPPGPGGGRGKTASERRSFFTSSGRKGSIWESFEARVLQEELEDETADGTGLEEVERSFIILQPSPQPLKTPTKKPLEAPQLQPKPTSPLLKPLLHSPPPPLPTPPIAAAVAAPHRPRLRRRDYSIDEKTDALFNEFLRHDPRFDQQDSPLRSRHRSRVHLRKQWQRHKQYSDPGSATGGRYSPSLERQRFTPLRRGDSAGYPLDTRYHSTLSRIASAADEEANEASGEGAEPKGPPSPDGREGEALRISLAYQDDDDNNGGTTNDASSDIKEESLVTRVQQQQHTVSSDNAASQPAAGGGTATSARHLPPDTQASAEAAGCMDPRADNNRSNNNSSRAIIPSDAAVSALSRVRLLPQSPHHHHHHVTPLPLPPSPSPPPRSILQSQRSLTDKLAVSVEERLYGGLRAAAGQQGDPCNHQGGGGGGGGGTTECVAVVTGSPGHSPV